MRFNIPLAYDKAKHIPTPATSAGLPYVYSGLPPNTIRIFELFAGKDDATITGSLRSVELKPGHEQYEAVSYAWGDTTLRRTIKCNGFILHTTENLFRTLSRLRNHDSNLVVWVDAICINQGTDNSALREKSQQVTMMNHIFSNASRVIVDLDADDDDFGGFLARLEQYATVDKNIWHISGADFVVEPGTQVPERLDAQLWHQLLKIMLSPCFQRLWCFQEFIVARQIAFLFGPRLVGSFDVHLAITRALLEFSAISTEYMLAIVEELGCDAPTLRRNLDVVRCRQVLRNCRQTNRHLILEDVFGGSRSLAVTDPRDKVYAIYALLPDDITADFRTDYGETMQDLQHRISLHLIQKNYGVLVLMHAIGPNKEQPSWMLCLDIEERLYWRMDTHAVCAGSTFDYSSESPGTVYHAGGRQSHKIRAETSSNDISAEGCIFDNVICLSNVIPSSQTDDLDVLGESLYDQLIDIWQWAEETGTPDEILWRVLMFDGYGDIRAADPNYCDDNATRPSLYRTSYQEMKKCVLANVEDPEITEAHMPFYLQFCTHMPNMRIAKTARGSIAAVPYTTNIGDKITILSGVPAPFVFRELGAKYQVVGACYLHGYMDGQALDDESWKPELLTIV